MNYESSNLYLTTDFCNQLVPLFSGWGVKGDLGSIHERVFTKPILLLIIAF
jgi:hypothetical protein